MGADALVTRLKGWDNVDRRDWAIRGLIAAVAVFVLGAIGAAGLGREGGTAVLVATILEIVVLLFLVALVYFGVMNERAAPRTSVHEAAATATASGPPPVASSVITLRCGTCDTMFDVEDTGSRPLKHVCPGCGTEGEVTSEMLSEIPTSAGVAAEGEPHEKTVKRLRVRCKSCATVFTLQDDGTRPLKQPCPGCKTMTVLK
jgi:phage FluMu protein Com